MDLMDDGSFKNFIDCLEIQEYVQFLTISKNIFNQAKRYRKLRQPCIMVLNVKYGGFGISDQCKIEMANLDDNKKNVCGYGVSRSDPILVRAILKIGSLKASDEYARLRFYTYPWTFREYIKIDEYDGMESSSIDEYAYMNKLIEKYKKKVDDVIGLDEKKVMESILFKKLVQKNEFLNSYCSWQDKHMDRLDKRLNDLIGFGLK